METSDIEILFDLPCLKSHLYVSVGFTPSFKRNFSIARCSMHTLKLLSAILINCVSIGPRLIKIIHYPVITATCAPPINSKSH